MKVFLCCVVLMLCILPLAFSESRDDTLIAVKKVVTTMSHLQYPCMNNTEDSVRTEIWVTWDKWTRKVFDEWKRSSTCGHIVTTENDLRWDADLIIDTTWYHGSCDSVLIH